ncbi:essential nuclear protein 1 [Paragonimus westermani]|uniref:Essential nuclear protein 1 n=1 Tax=Paragonimus westermani TaxID=34504 RepID=A0A5J4NH17_9TREM|nr:essential nuclear protein 1 [Paragonimus westermani]
MESPEPWSVQEWVKGQTGDFYENYLLPKVKQDIEENRRLCVQLFEALIASMFRPEEFVSGVFLPWIQSEMSKTEGIILAHLIKKATLKARFAAVALALSLEEEFSIPRSMVIEALLSKHYHMPEAALERVLQYFLRWVNVTFVHHKFVVPSQGSFIDY